MRQHLERRLEVLAREIRKRPPRLHAAPTPSWLDPRIRVFNEQHDALAVPVRTPGKSTLREVVETVAVGVASTSEHAGFKTGDRVVIARGYWCTGLTAMLELDLCAPKGSHGAVKTHFDQNGAWMSTKEKLAWCGWSLDCLGTAIKHLHPPLALPNGTRVRMTTKLIPREYVGGVGTIRQHIAYFEKEQRHSYDVMMEDGRSWLCGEPHFEVLAAEKRPFAVGQIRKIVATKEQLKECGLQHWFNTGGKVVITRTDYCTKIGPHLCTVRAADIGKTDVDSFAFPEEFLE